MRSAYLERVARDVAEYGWHLTVTEGFGYTTGLTGGDHPEILIAGLPMEVTYALAAGAVSLIRAGTPLLPGSRHQGIITGYLAAIGELPLETPRFPRGVTRAHYQRPVPAVQLLWPDKHGVFPGEPGCDPGIAAAQDPEEGHCDER